MDRKTVKEFEKLMKLALKQACQAQARGEVPVGAVVACRGKVIGRGGNRLIQKNDPTAHAEILALRQACRRMGNYRLAGCDLIVTLEPCAMCLGAAVQARVGRIVFGATDPKAGAVSSILRFPFAKMNHRPEVRGGVLGLQCGQILKDFFKIRRGRPSGEY
ncbi:MAG TPA: tRNA adenosine(34) deaminase TadA [Acidobacteriota bacterium]